MRERTSELVVEGLRVQVTRKSIKNMHLRVVPPGAQVRVSAPLRMKDETIRGFVMSKLDWVRARQAELLKRERNARREFVPGERHPLWGEELPLEITRVAASPSVTLAEGVIRLRARELADREALGELLESLYRRELKGAIPPLIARWEPVMGVRVAQWGVKRMKTRWGSCNPMACRIWLNLHLAKLPPCLLEYVVVHEMAHLLERGHGPAFAGWMDRFLPGWRELRAQLRAHELGL